MKVIKYIILLLLFSTNIYGEEFIIEKFQSSNHIYSCIIKYILKKNNDSKKVSIACENNIAYVSYANKNKIPFYKSTDNPNVFIKKRGAYIVNLFINKNKYNKIDKAHFTVTKRDKKVVKISLTQV